MTGVVTMVTMVTMLSAQIAEFVIRGSAGDRPGVVTNSAHRACWIVTIVTIVTIPTSLRPPLMAVLFPYNPKGKNRL